MLIEGSKEFKFAILSDSQPNYASNDGTIDDQLVMQLLTHNPEFILGCGDHNYPSGAEATWPYSTQASFVVPRIRNKVWFVTGNHDLDTNSGLCHYRHWNKGRYWTFTHNNVRFIGLAGGYNTSGALAEPDGNAYNSIQGRWCKTVLEESTSLFNFIFIHQPPWSSGAYSPGYPALRWPFKQWNASALFFGHEHIYQENYVDGFNYIGCPSGGGVLRAVSESLPSYCQYAWGSNYGFLIVTVDKFNAKIELYDINNVLIHTKVING